MLVPTCIFKWLNKWNGLVTAAYFRIHSMHLILVETQFSQPKFSIPIQSFVVVVVYGKMQPCKYHNVKTTLFFEERVI